MRIAAPIPRPLKDAYINTSTETKVQSSHHVSSSSTHIVSQSKPAYYSLVAIVSVRDNSEKIILERTESKCYFKEKNVAHLISSSNLFLSSSLCIRRFSLIWLILLAISNIVRSRYSLAASAARWDSSIYD